jgi:S1-C subfamily serine protease
MFLFFCWCYVCCRLVPPGSGTSGHVQVLTPTLGITFATDRVSRSLNAAPGEGALIQAVDAKSAAAAAGLLGTRRGLGGIVAGDVVTGVDSRRVRYAQDVAAALDNAQVRRMPL